MPRQPVEQMIAHPGIARASPLLKPGDQRIHIVVLHSPAPVGEVQPKLERGRLPDVPVIAEPCPLPELDIAVHEFPLHVLDRFVGEQLEGRCGERLPKAGEADARKLGPLPGIFFPAVEVRPELNGLGRTQGQGADGEVAGVRARRAGEVAEQFQFSIGLSPILALGQKPQEVDGQGRRSATALPGDRKQFRARAPIARDEVQVLLQLLKKRILLVRQEVLGQIAVIAGISHLLDQAVGPPAADIAQSLQHHPPDVGVPRIKMSFQDIDGLFGLATHDHGVHQRKDQVRSVKASQHLRRQMVRMGAPLELIQRSIEEFRDWPIGKAFIPAEDHERRSRQHVPQEICLIALGIPEDLGKFEVL